jgi:hypothetical protein
MDAGACFRTARITRVATSPFLSRKLFGDVNKASKSGPAGLLSGAYLCGIASAIIVTVYALLYVFDWWSV